MFPTAKVKVRQDGGKGPAEVTNDSSSFTTAVHAVC